MRNAIGLLLILVFSSLTHGQKPIAPMGWRFPTVKDFSGDWLAFKKDVPMPYKIAGDFNWDRLRDEAWILISTSGSHTGVFVFLGQKDKTFRLVQLDYFEEEKAQGFHLAVADKGKYDTACGKGYWNCSESEPPILDLKAQGIWIVAYESATKIYYWNPLRKTFESVAISD